jgi:hypothetical protein
MYVLIYDIKSARTGVRLKVNRCLRRAGAKGIQHSMGIRKPPAIAGTSQGDKGLWRQGDNPKEGGNRAKGSLDV